MALWPPTLADASSFCPTENSPPVLSHTLKDQKHKNAMSQRSYRAKIFVRPASYLHCATKGSLRISRPRRQRCGLTAMRSIRPKENYRVSDYFVGCSARALSLMVPPYPLSVGTTHSTIGLFRASIWAPRKADDCGPYRDIMTRTVHERLSMRTGWYTQRLSGRTPHRTVAYLGPADTYDGPVLSRLRGARQSVRHPHSGFTTPPAVLLASLCTHCSRALPRGPPRRHG